MFLGEEIGTLIGSPDPLHPTLYSAAGGSIAGNGPHNPFIAGGFTETFTVASLAGISISTVNLQFGLTFTDVLESGLPILINQLECHFVEVAVP